LVQPLSWILNELRVPHFFDKNMEVGEENVSQMAQACFSCLVGVVIVSDDFLQSKWCLKELNTFLQREKQHEGGFLLFPVFYNPALLSSDEYRCISRLCSCLPDAHHPLPWAFLCRKLLPALLNLQQIQELPCIESCRKKLAKDPLLFRRLCNQYQVEFVPKAAQMLLSEQAVEEEEAEADQEKQEQEAGDGSQVRHCCILL